MTVLSGELPDKDFREGLNVEEIRANDQGLADRIGGGCEFFKLCIGQKIWDQRAAIHAWSITQLRLAFPFTSARPHLLLLLKLSLLKITQISKSLFRARRRWTAPRWSAWSTSIAILLCAESTSHKPSNERMMANFRTVLEAAEGENLMRVDSWRRQTKNPFGYASD